MVQRLRLHAPNAGGPGSIPGQGTRSHIPQIRPGAAKQITTFSFKISISKKKIYQFKTIFKKRKPLHKPAVSKLRNTVESPGTIFNVPNSRPQPRPIKSPSGGEAWASGVFEAPQVISMCSQAWGTTGTHHGFPL